MITITILSIILFISIAINISTVIALMKGINREKIYTDWILKFRTRVEEVYKELKTIDEKNIFEKDDEVGVVFTELVKIMKEFDDEVK